MAKIKYWDRLKSSIERGKEGLNTGIPFQGFTTLSKTAAGDAITAKYTGPTVTVDGKRGGFLSKARGLVGLGIDNNALISGESYRITIRNEQGSPIIRFARVNAKGISNAAHAKIITLLNNAFNS